MPNPKFVALIASVLAILAFDTKSVADTQSIDFEGISSLSQLEINGLTFSANISLGRRARLGSG